MSTTAIIHTAGLPRTSPTAPQAAAPLRRPEGARALATLLLAAAVAALAVIADQLISTWADGHLFAAWVSLWAVVFAGSLLLAGTARRLSQRAMAVLDAWASRRAAARAEARFMALARHDPRLMADLRVVRDRASASADEQAFSQALAPLGMSNDTTDRRQEWRLSQAEQIRFADGRACNLYYI